MAVMKTQRREPSYTLKEIAEAHAIAWRSNNPHDYIGIRNVLRQELRRIARRRKKGKK